jgi:hypothetical protein
MALPVIPSRSLCETINDLAESIAMEEAAIAHILNAEGEKMQKLVNLATTTTELTDYQKALSAALQTIIKTEMLLQFKLEKVLDIANCPLPAPYPPTEE